MKNLDVYDAMIARVPEVERKGKTMLYTSANGYMFSQLNKAGEIGIRLPKERGAEFIAKHDAGPFLSYGAVMRDYVLVPAHLHTDIDLLAATLAESYAYVMSLPPKSGKK